MAAQLFKTLLLVGLASEAMARKTYLVKASPMAAYQPTVRAYTCSYCVFQNNDDKFCIDYLVELEIGWKFYQQNIYTLLPTAAGSTAQAVQDENDNYRIRWELYSKQQGTLHPELDLPRIYYNENTLKSSEEFNTYLALEFVYHYSAALLCFNAYFNYDSVDLTWEMAVKIQECYKILISCFYDWENEWNGDDAKVLSSCDQSSKETITIWKLALTETPMYASGNTDAITKTGTDCKPGTTGLPFGSLAAGPLQDRLFVNLLSYFGDKGQSDNYDENAKSFRIPDNQFVQQNFNLF